MAFVKLKPGALLSPVPPVLVTCAGENIRPNGLAVGWAGTVNTIPPMCSVSIRPGRYSHDIIRDSGEFVINLCGKDMMQALDYCGVRSGRDEDKLKKCGLTCVEAEGMQYAPAVAESPLYLACKVESVTPLGSHDLFVGRVVGMGVREDLLDESGRIALDRADLLAYSHGTYYELGQSLGFFGFSVAKKDVYHKRMKELRGNRRK